MVENCYIPQNIATRFKQFEAKMKDNLQEFIMLDHAMKSYVLQDLSYPSIYTGDDVETKALFYSGKKSHFIDMKNARVHFIEAIIMFETYINYLATVNYGSFPEKLGKEPLDSKKMMDLIYKYDNTQDIIEKIIEEKIRSIFYGNPANIFLKDTRKLGLGSYFKDSYSNEINYFVYLIAIRNIIIHNDSRVDSKFLREVESDYKLKEKIKINQDFLLGTTALLVGLASEITRIYVESAYKFIPRKTSILYSSSIKFRKLCKTDFFIKNFKEKKC